MSKWENKEFTDTMQKGVAVLDRVLHGDPASVSEHEFLEAASNLQSGLNGLIKLTETARSEDARTSLVDLQQQVASILVKANIEILDVSAAEAPKADRAELALNAGQSIEPISSTPKLGG